MALLQHLFSNCSSTQMGLSQNLLEQKITSSILLLLLLLRVIVQPFFMNLTLNLMFVVHLLCFPTFAWQTFLLSAPCPQQSSNKTEKFHAASEFDCKENIATVGVQKQATSLLLTERGMRTNLLRKILPPYEVAQLIIYHTCLALCVLSSQSFHIVYFIIYSSPRVSVGVLHILSVTFRVSQRLSMYSSALQILTCSLIDCSLSSF